MIRVLNAPPRYRELRARDVASAPRIDQVASALPPAIIARFASQLERMTALWGTVAASSFTAAFLGEITGADGEDFRLVVREFGTLAWVEAGNGMMRPNPLNPWFSFDGLWLGLPRPQGLQRLVTENADAALANPVKTIDAVRAAVVELRLHGSPVVSARQITVAEAKFQGCIGPGSLDVDTGVFTLSTERTEPWEQQYSE